MKDLCYVINNPPKDYYFVQGAIYFPYYYHRLQGWNRGLVIRYNKNMKTLSKFRSMIIRPEKTLTYKDNPYNPIITHCSYSFKNFDEYKNKLKSYIHQEYNKPPYITNNWIFKSHYCREKIHSPKVQNDELYEGWNHLIPNDNRLKYLVDRSFMYQLNQTNYTEKDLETLCDTKYNRSVFELSAKYKYNS